MIIKDFYRAKYIEYPFYIGAILHFDNGEPINSKYYIIEINDEADSIHRISEIEWFIFHAFRRVGEWETVTIHELYDLANKQNIELFDDKHIYLKEFEA